MCCSQSWEAGLWARQAPLRLLQRGAEHNANLSSGVWLWALTAQSWPSEVTCCSAGRRENVNSLWEGVEIEMVVGSQD